MEVILNDDQLTMIIFAIREVATELAALRGAVENLTEQAATVAERRT
jgi:hypothetical protein